MVHARGDGLTEQNINELKCLRGKFISITGIEDNQAEVFLAKVAIADEPVLKSFRLPIEKTLFID